MFNYARERAQDVAIKLDLANLGLNPKYATARTLWAEEGGQARLDAGTGLLRVKSLPAHRLLLVGIVTHEAGERERAARALPAWVEGGLPELDFYGRRLTLRGIPTKAGRLVAIRKY